MTHVQLFNTTPRSETGDRRRAEASPESQAFRDALAQQSFGRLAATLDPSATASLPGAGVALAAAPAAAPTDAAGLASAELVKQDRQMGIRERGLDVASNSTQELRSRSSVAPESAQASQTLLAEAERAQPQRPDQAGSAPRAGEQTTSQSSANTPQRETTRADAGQHANATANSPSTPASGDASAARAAVTGQAPPTPSAARSAAVVQAVNALSAAQPGAKPASSAQPFSIERAAAGTDRAASAKPARAQAQPPDPTAQIQRGLAQVLRQRGGTLTMKLTPNELGEIKIALQMQQSRVTGTIDAQTVAARDLLKQNIDALKASLEQRGVTVDRLDVRLQGAAESDVRAQNGAEPRHEHANTQAGAGGDRPTGDAGGGDRHTGSRGGSPGSPERSDDRGAAAPDRDDGQGRPVEHAGGWLRLDTTA